MFQENSIETCILSRVKQITSPGWMHETSARTWCLGGPGGSGWRGRWEGGSGWGTHVNSRPFHFNVWQNSLQIKKKNLFVAVLDVASLKLRCQQVWFPLSSVSLACTWQSSHCALHLAFSLCSGVAGFPFSYVNTSHFVLNPTLVTSFNHYYLFKSLVSEYSHILR